MKPIDPELEGYPTVVFAEDQPEYEPLPAAIVGNALYTKWQLTENERRAIMDGARVDLLIWTCGRPLQPVVLQVEGVEP